jgi:hypothetical protein
LVAGEEEVGAEVLTVVAAVVVVEFQLNISMLQPFPALLP